MLLIRGSIGPQVTELQEALTAAGFPVDVDGTYGATTEEAVREFQAAQGLAADGSYGPNTHKAMLAAIEAAEEEGDKGEADDEKSDDEKSDDEKSDDEKSDDEEEAPAA